MTTLRNTTAASIVVRALREVQTVPPSKFIGSEKTPGAIEVSNEFWGNVKDNVVVQALIADGSLLVEAPVVEAPVVEAPVVEAKPKGKKA